MDGAKGIALTKQNARVPRATTAGVRPGGWRTALRKHLISRMYVPENCARPRARAHLVMCPWLFAQIPSEHPCANASTHKMRLRDNTGATLSPT